MFIRLRMLLWLIILVRIVRVIFRKKKIVSYVIFMQWDDVLREFRSKMSESIRREMVMDVVVMCQFIFKKCEIVLDLFIVSCVIVRRIFGMRVMFSMVIIIVVSLFSRYWFEVSGWVKQRVSARFRMLCAIIGDLNVVSMIFVNYVLVLKSERKMLFGWKLFWVGQSRLMYRCMVSTIIGVYVRMYRCCIYFLWQSWCSSVIQMMWGICDRGLRGLLQC